jgi:hypothetical protein
MPPTGEVAPKQSFPTLLTLDEFSHEKLLSKTRTSLRVATAMRFDTTGKAGRARSADRCSGPGCPLRKRQIAGAAIASRWRGESSLKSALYHVRRVFRRDEAEIAELVTTERHLPLGILAGL